MGLMRGDMTGAAVVFASLYAAGKLGASAPIVAIGAMCENMPSGHAVKPGDVVTARNGKTIEVGVLFWICSCAV